MNGGLEPVDGGGPPATAGRGYRWFSIRTVLVCLIMPLVLSACGAVESIRNIDVSVNDPVWLRDDWIYYLRQSNSDAPWEIWRRRPDGSGNARFAASVPTVCPHPTFVFLFKGPNGGLGAGLKCAGQGGQTELMEYSGGQATRPLGEFPDADAATWRGGGGGGGYVEQMTQSCWGITPVGADLPVTFAEPMSLNGVTWIVDPSKSNYACEHSASTKSPAINADGSSVYFLATTDMPPNPVERNADSLSWRLCRWDKGARQPVVVGPTLTGANNLRLTPDGRRGAVDVHAPGNSGLYIVRLADGKASRLMPGEDIVGMDFSPDGHRLVVINTSDDIKVIEAHD